MMLKLLPVALVAVVVALGFSLPNPPPAGDPDVIRIVSSLPRSGSAKGQTDTIVDGIRLAMEEAGRKVTLNGKDYRLEYKDLDDATAAAGQWTAEQETNNANLAKRDPDVMVYIGTYNSGAASISMPILNLANILMISPANTAVSLTKPGTGERDEPMRYRRSGKLNYLRVVPTDDFQGAAGAEWTKQLGCQKVYILDDNEVYGKGIADLYEAHARRIGLEVLGHESIDSKAQEFKALMTKIKGLNADMLYFGGTTQTKAGQVAKDLASNGPPNCKMMGPDGCYEQALFQAAGPDVLNNRFYVTFGGLTVDKLIEDPQGKKFVDRYQKLYNKPPAEAYALYGYECGRVAIEAIRRAGKKDRDAIREAAFRINQEKPFEGVMGTWWFDKNGDTTQQAIYGIEAKLETVDNKTVGKFVFAKKLNVTLP